MNDDFHTRIKESVVEHKSRVVLALDIRYTNREMLFY